MNSHILIPKCVLKQFALNGGRLFCYDLKESRMASGYAATLNTKEGYYSREIEQFLSANIETPIGKVIGILKKGYDDLEKTGKFEIKISAQNFQVLKNYVYSLLTRSPNMAKQVKENLIFRECFSPQNIHDIAFYDGYNLVQKDAFLNDFKLSFIFCESQNEYVIPMQGYCTYLYGKTECCVVQLTSKIAMLLFKGDDFNSGVSIVPKEYVDKINDISFEQQMEKNFGFIAAMNKKTIEETIARYNKNAKDEK